MVGLDKPGLVTKLNILVHVNIRRLKPYHARAQPVQLGSVYSTLQYKPSQILQYSSASVLG
jgi:hypothetical protein